VFERAYVTQPVCTPSRASLLTGLYPHAHGCTQNNTPLAATTLTLAELVSPDYARAYMGKRHLGDEVIAQHGFETWVSTEDNYRRHYSRPEFHERLSSYHHYLVAQGFTPDTERVGLPVFSRKSAARLPEPHTKARYTGREAARFIREHAGRPWVLYVNFLEPHPPYLGPLDDYYAPASVPDGPAFLQPPPDDAPLVNRLLSESHRAEPDEDGQDLRTEAGWRKTRAKYLGNITLVDRAVGEILQALDESGQSARTLVVFTSDHGDQMGDHGLLGKCVMYEESLRVPLLLRVPWLDGAPRRVAAPLSLVDLVPTLLDLLAEPLPGHLQGRSRAATLAGGSPLADDVVIEWNGTNARGQNKIKRTLTGDERARLNSPWRAIVTPDGWKLCLSPVDVGELYDLNSDPHELANLFDDPAQRGRRRDLADRLRAWQVRQHDDVPLSDG
jgi:arylsulfatase A-like enzyme